MGSRGITQRWFFGWVRDLTFSAFVSFSYETCLRGKMFTSYHARVSSILASRNHENHDVYTAFRSLDTQLTYLRAPDDFPSIHNMVTAALGHGIRVILFSMLTPRPCYLASICEELY